MVDRREQRAGHSGSEVGQRLLRLAPRARTPRTSGPRPSVCASGTTRAYQRTRADGTSRCQASLSARRPVPAPTRTRGPGHQASKAARAMSAASTSMAEPRLLHALAGRARIHVPAWSGAPAAALDAQLRRLPGVRSAQANPLTGNVLVRFDPAAATAQTILEAVRALGSSLGGGSGRRPHWCTDVAADTYPRAACPAGPSGRDPTGPHRRAGPRP